MKGFNFSLEKILELRTFEKEKAQAELGKANAEVNRIQELLDAVAAQKIAMQQSLDSAGPVDILTYSNSQNYLQFLEQKKESYLQEMAQAKLVQEQKRQVFQEAMKKEKILEKLKEKKFLQWKKENQKAEELETDDIISAKGNEALE